MEPNLHWNMTDLRALCKAIVYFDRSLQALLPAHRTSGNVYCKQNYSGNPRLSALDIGECFDEINSMSGLKDLKHVKNADGEGGSTRYYAWNFTNLEFNPSKGVMNGTVEYRNPSYANDARTCTAWMTLATTFVGAARRASHLNASTRRDFAQDLGGLRSFLAYGSERWTRKVDYINLFPEGSSGSSRPSTARAAEPASRASASGTLQFSRSSRNGDVIVERRRN